MGLDCTELIMEVEERFQVRLSDADCSGVRTVADLAALVIRRLPPPSGVCPAARAFYELRRRFVTAGERPRERIRPSTALAELFPAQDRSCWNQVRGRDARLPQLVVTKTAGRMLLRVLGFLVLTWATFTLCVSHMLPENGGAAVLIIGFVAIGFIYARLRRRYSTEFPPGLETVGDLAKSMALVEMPRSLGGERLMVQLRILEEVRQITAEQMSLPLGKVRPESRFVEDLKIS